MPIIRNPFRRNDETLRISGNEKTSGAPEAPPRHIDIKEQTEYKLSEINDSGVYLPPSPTERKNFWSTKSNTSSNSSNHRSVLNENEPFNISRESFDSYRRSFDISARSPVLQGEARPRVSLDSRLHSNPPRHSSSFNRPLPPAEEDTFEDVGLNDDVKPRRQGFLSRFTHSGEGPEPRPSSGLGFHVGRKRGQSGGQELNSMPKPDESNDTAVKGGED
ncbi:hypothetical protein AAFC00_005551 [Neodothiora populina]|uniref:Uncharacterized protein n=1 Tax=Neodothiora populina TaxID=2781224 RepID=A0ABR3PLK8_9PEZI